VKETNINYHNDIYDIYTSCKYIIDNFIYNTLINCDNISQIDSYDYFNLLIEQTVNNLSKILLKYFSKILSDIDERELIKLYKNKYKKDGIVLKTHKKYTRSLLSTNGVLTISRYVLRPNTKEDKAALLEKEGKSTVAPLDEILKIAHLPFKMTVPTMLEVAEWSTSQLSYHSASYAILKSLKVNINQETIRLVTDYIGKLVFDMDVQKAEESYAVHTSGKLRFPNEKIDHVLYIQVDGEMLHTRQKGEASVWKENKIGIVFSSDNIVPLEIHNSEMYYDIKKREYVCFLDSVELFQKLLYNIALKNGYGRYKKTVLVSDGTKWIHNMKELLFPDAQQILDFRSLCKNLYNFCTLYFNNNGEEYKIWAEKIKEMFKNSDSALALFEIKEIENNINKHVYNHNNNNLFKLSNYIENNINNIDYKEYQKQGLYIGGGHIESDNKSLAQERLIKPGVIWGQNNAQHLLTLRAKMKSNLWGKEVVIPTLRHFKIRIVP
jgi:hypothetical protein